MEGLTPFVVKYRLCKYTNWVEVMRRRPVVLSNTAPVADLYLLNPSVASKMRVVPVQQFIYFFQ